MKMRTTILAWALAAVVTGCSSTRVVSHRDPQADFERYRTYGFLEPLGTDDASYRTLTSNALIAATEGELQARGYVPAEEPDLLVNFHVQTSERVRSIRAPSSYFLFRSDCAWPYGAWGGYPAYETTVRSYTEGTLHIDVIERERRQVVWDAAVVDRLSAPEQDDAHGWAASAVGLAFERFPREPVAVGAPSNASGAPGTAPEQGL